VRANPTRAKRVRENVARTNTLVNSRIMAFNRRRVPGRTLELGKDHTRRWGKVPKESKRF